LARTTTSGTKFVVWDDSSADTADYYPGSPSIWPRLDDSRLLLQGARGAEQRLPIIKRSAAPRAESSGSTRERRDASAEPSAEKIPSTKSVREARMGSQDGWSRQPQEAQYRHRANLERQHTGYEVAGDADGDEAANLPALLRTHYAPKAEFVTSPRARAPVDPRRLLYPEARESRDLLVARTYDDYDVPVFRNIVREHDFDVQIPRNYYYPSRYGAQVIGSHALITSLGESSLSLPRGLRPLPINPIAFVTFPARSALRPG
jgi:hypothetical protein